MNTRSATLVIHICITAILFLSLTQYLVQQFIGLNVTGPIILALTFTTLVFAAVSGQMQAQWGLGLLIVFLAILAFRNVGEISPLTQASLAMIPVVILGLCVRVEIETLLHCLAVAGVVLIVALALQGTYVDGRLALSDTNPIWIARMGCLAFLAVLFTSPIRHRSVNWTIAASLTALMWLTESRGPILAAWGSLLLFAALKVTGRIRSFFVIGILIVSVTAGELLGATGLPVRSNGEVSTEWRLAAWQQALQFWTARPVLGYGVAFDAQTNGLEPYPHNAFIELLVQTGVVGLAIFAVVLWLTWRSNESPIFRSLFAAVLIFSAFSGSIWGAYELWLFAVLRVSTRTSSDPHHPLRSRPTALPAASPPSAKPGAVAARIHRALALGAGSP